MLPEMFALSSSWFLDSLAWIINFKEFVDFPLWKIRNWTHHTSNHFHLSSLIFISYVYILWSRLYLCFMVITVFGASVNSEVSFSVCSSLLLSFLLFSFLQVSCDLWLSGFGFCLFLWWKCWTDYHRCLYWFSVRLGSFCYKTKQNKKTPRNQLWLT